jgi:diguanylate cyclase (GGDEF)-like protein
MPQPGEAFQPQPSAEESFMDLLVETLEGLDEAVRGQFLRQYFRTIAQIDLGETQSNQYWDRILQRRRELAESLGKRVSLKTAMVDVLASTNFLRVPILMEYDDLKKLQFNAATDALTGLHNRRLFDESCDRELNRAKRYGHQLAIVILDLHKLKEVNDRYGHLQGDKVLQLAAKTVRATIRASDLAFRIGGDEFALLLPQTEREQADTLCGRIRAQYESEINSLKLDIPVTLDFGVAVHPQDGDQKGALMSVADQRLYQLKYAGRTPSRVVPLEPHPPREAPPPTPQPKATAPPTPTPAPAPSLRAVPHAEQRKWERVSLAGTKANAVLADDPDKTATVIDLSYGGVALQVDKPEDLPNQFSAVLNVPILPPVRVVLRKIYANRLESGRSRVGCAFVS